LLNALTGIPVERLPGWAADRKKLAFFVMQAFYKEK
jgi:hypothetical protein